MGKWFEMTKHPLNTGCFEFQESLPRGLLYQIRKETKQLKQLGILFEGFTKCGPRTAPHFFLRQGFNWLDDEPNPGKRVAF